VRSAIRVATVGLAEEFHLLALDHLSGASRLHQRSTARSLAACPIAELLRVWSSMHGPTAAAPPHLWHVLVRERWCHPMTTWLGVVEPNAGDQLVARLGDCRSFCQGWPQSLGVGGLHHREAAIARLWVALCSCDVSIMPLGGCVWRVGPESFVQVRRPPSPRGAPAESPCLAALGPSPCCRAQLASMERR